MCHDHRSFQTHAVTSYNMENVATYNNIITIALLLLCMRMLSLLRLHKTDHSIRSRVQFLFDHSGDSGKRIKRKNITGYNMAAKLTVPSPRLFGTQKDCRLK